MGRQFNFTVRSINALESPQKGKLFYYYDTKIRGLSLIVTPRGTKTFYIYKKIKGKAERIKVGRYPDLSIEQSRKKALTILAKIAQDKNPAAEKRKIRNEMTLSELFLLYTVKHSSINKKERTCKDDLYTYNTHLAQWNDIRISDIRPSMIQDLINDIGRRNGKIRQANKVRSLLHGIYEFAIKREYEGMNPCRKVERFREIRRDKFLQDGEIKRFFDTIKHEIHPFIKDYLLIALFTGARRSNIEAMRWDELDFDNATWTIPPEKFKTETRHTIPLVPFLIDLLCKRQERIESEWVFPGNTSEGHIGYPQKPWMNFCIKAGFDDLTIHDLRRTLASWMAMTGATELIIAKALGHKKDSSSITAIYARLDIEPVRKAMETAVDAMLVAGEVITSGEIVELEG